MARILITGTHSGCGKTTLVCALLMALKKRGLQPAAFKCGPDYIDPMFHRRAIGIPAYNLDPFFCTDTQLKSRLSRNEPGLSLLEGAMGYYDGIGPEGYCSAYAVARATDTPAVLVVDIRGMYASAGAVLKGFAEYRRPSGIQGVIFNRTSPPIYTGLAALAEKAGLKPLGFLPKEAKAGIESRHLGLVTAGDIPDLEEKLACLGALAEKHLDLDGLLALAADAPPLEVIGEQIPPLGRVRIAIPRDAAFCFLYEENLELLRALGCKLIFFSPLTDTELPPDIAGLYLCGGYPELHLQQLSQNTALLADLKKAVESGLPTLAECGGFLYLHQTLDGFPMVGVIPAAAYKTEKLQCFGYITLRAQTDNLLCAAGESIRAHEFHYYASNLNGRDFIAEKPCSERSWPCIHAHATLYAGFPHLYFEANPAFAENFVRKALAYAAAKGKETSSGS